MILLKAARVLLFLLAVFTAVLLIFFLVAAVFLPKKEIVWGVNFSQKYAEELGLDWKKSYLAILDDLGANEIKLLTQWDFLEPKQDEFFWEDLDWQVKEAEKRSAKIILVLGLKSGRWPECHLPVWAENLDKESKQVEINELIETAVRRFKNSPSIYAWQVENEPFLEFGICPERVQDFVKIEVEAVKKSDSKHQIIVSDSGEWSMWFKAARYGDVVGTTLYRKVWFAPSNRELIYPMPAVFYGGRAKLIKWFFDKEVINVELQAEPWGRVPVYELSLEEQKKLMPASQFKKNLEYARRTGLDRFYLWGAEWWYLMKEKHGESFYWDESRKLFYSD